MKRSELFFAFFQLPLDCVMVVFSFILAYKLRSNLESTPLSLEFGLDTYVLYAIYLLPLWILLFTLNGLYTIRNYFGFLSEFYRVFVASSTAIMFLAVFIFLSKSLFFSRLILIFTWVISILLVYLGRILLLLIQRSLLKRGIGKRNILLVGPEEISVDVASEILNSNKNAYKIVGIIPTTKSLINNLKVLGGIEDFERILKKHQIDEVILTDSFLPKEKKMNLIGICYDSKIAFKFIPDLYALMTSNLQTSLIGTIPVVELKQIPLEGWGRIIKRIIDFVFSLVFLAVLSPVMLVIALLVKLSSKGPVFFVHDRIGRDEKVFKFYKFRSMYTDKCDWEQKGVWTTANDEKTRITPFGRILRKTNLDELPQLFSILKGDMSFVGPRPEQPTLVNKFEKDIPSYFRRHRVKAGLTSWASVNGLKGDTSVEERVKYDIYYIENWSLWFDIKIILKTIGLVLNEAFAGKSEYRPRT